MASRDSSMQTINRILMASVDLFREQGFIATNIRQIAEKAGISLGLVNHYFESKTNLGYICDEVLVRYVLTHIDMDPRQTGDWLLFDTLCTRVVNVYMNEGPFHKFYEDTLEEDLFFHYLESHSSPILCHLQEKYNFTISKEMALIYCQCIPFMTEKTLLLKRRDGMFLDIPDDDIPYHISLSSYRGFVPEADIRAADAQSRVLSGPILATLSPIPSEDELMDIIQSMKLPIRHSSFCGD